MDKEILNKILFLKQKNNILSNNEKDVINKLIDIYKIEYFGTLGINQIIASIFNNKKLNLEYFLLKNKILDKLFVFLLDFKKNNNVIDLNNLLALNCFEIHNFILNELKDNFNVKLVYGDVKFNNKFIYNVNESNYKENIPLGKLHFWIEIDNILLDFTIDNLIKHYINKIDLNKIEKSNLLSNYIIIILDEKDKINIEYNKLDIEIDFYN